MGYNPHEPDRRDAEQRAADETADRRERMEKAIKGFLVNLMRDERVGRFGEPDFDDFTEDLFCVIQDTNVISDAYEDLTKERENAGSKQ